jgi:hypothetical protein
VLGGRGEWLAHHSGRGKGAEPFITGIIRIMNFTVDQIMVLAASEI